MADVSLRLESIGDAQRHKYWLHQSGKAKMGEQAARGAASLMGKKPFVKLVVGMSPKGRPVKREIVGFKDYTSVQSGIGQRGVFYCYSLREGGMYLIREQISQKRTKEYWAFVWKGRIHRVSEAVALDYASRARDAQASFS